MAHEDDLDPAAAEFVLQFVRALHAYGESAQRLEDLVRAISERLGLRDVQLFSQPTGIMAAFGPLGRQQVHMLRVVPGAVNLGKLAEVERVALDVAHGRQSAAHGVAELARIAAAPPPYGPALTIAAVALVSGIACQFLGGGRREIVVATLLGLELGLLDRLAASRPRVGGVFEPLAAFLVSLTAVALAQLFGPFAVLVATLGGLIVLVPGLTLTTALNELASRHLASGTARLSGAVMTFLTIAFGVALGNRAAASVLGTLPAAAPDVLPPWAGLAARVVAPVCFVVIFRAGPRDLPWILVTGLLGVQFARAGAATLGPELGAFAGAFTVALAGRLYERWRHRPAAIVTVPGLVLLVPGSVGFLSLTSLMERQVLAGIETAFSAVITAMALVAGLLVAGVLVPERRVWEARAG